MENEGSTATVSALKFLKWSFLIALILVCSFAILYGINMHFMQASQIKEISRCIDTGEMGRAIHLANKDMIITQGFLFLSFIISVFCLILIIIFPFLTDFLIHDRNCGVVGALPVP